MSQFDALPLSAKLADILARYDMSGPTVEADATGVARHVYLLTKSGKASDTRRVVREFSAGEEIWYADDVPFYARHKARYYAEAVRRFVVGLPHGTVPDPGQ